MKLINNRQMYTVAAGAVLFFYTIVATGTEAPKATSDGVKAKDPHYTPAGFFDIHVCNWPDRKPFFMSLFSTTRYSEVTGIDVYYPDGNKLTSLNLEKYRISKPKGKPEKHVFMNQTEIPDGAKDGWYTATIDLADGTKILAKDYVIITYLPRVSGMNPPDGAEDIPVPEKLSWTPVNEARYYQVFISDRWDEGKLIHTSKLLDKPELVVPPGLLESDGLYTWKVHARDINEDVILGDFNKGSIGPTATFSTSGD